MTTASSQKLDWLKFAHRDADGNLPKIDERKLLEGVFDENVDQLCDLDRYMLSIYIRAIHECKKYFLAYDRYISTEYSTTLQPRVRWRLGRAVEMEWIRRVATEKPATSRELQMYQHPLVKKWSNNKNYRKTRPSLLSTIFI